MGTIDNIMKLMHVTTKDPHLDSRNFIFIRRQRKVISYMRNMQLAPNTIFDVITQYITQP